MYKRQLFVFLLQLWLGSAILHAQTPTITAPDIHLMVGKWKGTLTYLDYSTEKPYTMPANVKIDFLPKSKEHIFYNTYPNEPKANNSDTVIVSKNGNMLNNEAVRTKTKLRDGTIQITTEYAGTDGNDDKPALIRHTYTLGKHIFRKRKEVQFVGQTGWIKRNEFSYTKE